MDDERSGLDQFLEDHVDRLALLLVGLLLGCAGLLAYLAWLLENI
jgi:hypothetical protein